MRHLRAPYRMRLKLYCNRYQHFKDPLVCSVSCPYRTRCQDFALFYDEHRDDIDGVVEEYFAVRAGVPQQRRALVSATPTADLRSLIRLEVKREMAEAAYIWIGKDDQAELLELEEIIRRAERGVKPKHIYKVTQEMELRFQLVPRKHIEKAKRVAAATASRAAARRKPLRSPVPVEQPPAPLATAASNDNASKAQPPRRTRRAARVAKAAGER